MFQTENFYYNRILEICQHFRSVLEHANNPPDYMKPFPVGWCGATSRALGGYLLSIGIRPIERVCGYKAALSHAWLEYENYIIDITADQFDDCDERVFVTTNRSYHNTFSNVKKRQICLEDMNPYPEIWIVRVATQK